MAEKIKGKEVLTHTKELIDQYDKNISILKGIERKGASMPYTSLNGHMFSFINKNGQCGLRLKEEDRTLFIEKYKTTLCVENGSTLKEYVYIPETLFSNTKTIQTWFRKSFEYIAILKPKTTKKK